MESFESNARALAGLICNGVKRDHFLFSKNLSAIRFARSWQQGFPNYLSAAQYAELSEDEEDAFRTVFKLSAPDSLLHRVFGRFLSGNLELILSAGCYAYRPGNGQPGAVKAVRKLQENRTKWVVRFDVKGFNKSVDHTVLRECVIGRVLPLLTADERRIVQGVVNALLELRVCLRIHDY